MTRNTKIKLLIGTGAIISVLILAYFIIIPVIIKNTLNFEPGDPKLEITETHQIGWWAYQDSLTIKDFRVEIIESRLNLFNTKSLIRYTISAKLKHKKPWKPFIKEVHVSQRFTRKYDRNLHPYLEGDPDKRPEAVIEFTPVVKVQDDKSYTGSPETFTFTNELILESFHWGNNRVRFKCGSRWQDIILQQRK